MDDTKKHAQFLVDTALKLRMMAELPADFLRFVAEIETNPTPENLQRIERWNRDAAEYLQKKAAQVSQPSQPTPSVQSNS